MGGASQFPHLPCASSYRFLEMNVRMVCIFWTQVHRLYNCLDSSVVSSLGPRNQKTVSDLHVSLFRINSPCSVTISRSEWPDHRACSIRLRRHRVRLRLNICFITCKLFSSDEGASRWLSMCVRVPIHCFVESSDWP
ncbi:hypothetical protein K443DRAFT_612768 [Laccaria amethystina LaAM-08-1]|uniref:Uncharacterized protein n=1 Tax=Laccaria amethystina LaAM-08-1 TaxID=1095629 RepID=A0A0C9X5N4_9AGAR|nr:hypothetical protein K443DRAFT_612768 [Laccaria amethystina LaAM-08-1]